MADESPETTRRVLEGIEGDRIDRLAVWYGQWMLVALLVAIPGLPLAGLSARSSTGILLNLVVVLCATLTVVFVTWAFAALCAGAFISDVLG
jgi:hypothetical protein